MMHNQLIFHIRIGFLGISLTQSFVIFGCELRVGLRDVVCVGVCHLGVVIVNPNSILCAVDHLLSFL